MTDVSIESQFSALKRFPFCCRAVVYLRSGRHALWHAMKIMGLSRNDEILLPAYNCGAEIAPLVKWGARVRLYGVDAKLRIDIDDLKGKINRNTKAILVTHYFGFPQPADVMRKICDENGLYLIEDCAHALFSRYQDRPVGSLGDVAVFSLKKFLPLPDGGILAINNAKLRHSEKLIFPPLPYELAGLASHFLLKITGTNSKALLIAYKFVRELFRSARFESRRSSKGKGKVPSIVGIDLRKADWAMSKVSSALLKKFDKNKCMDHMIEKRKDNFRLILDEIEKSTAAVPLFDNLPEGVCPSLFPVVVRERDKTSALLLRKGILCFKTWPIFFPDMPWDQFPAAVFLKKNVISLSISHLIHERDLLRAVKLLQN